MSRGDRRPQEVPDVTMAGATTAPLTMRHTRVTIQTLLGAICIYLLIGLLFA